MVLISFLAGFYAIVFFLFGRFLGLIGIFHLYIGYVLISLILIGQWWQFLFYKNKIFFINLWAFLNINNSFFYFTFYYDLLAFVMVVLIVILSTCICFYSFEYLKYDMHNNRFVGLLLFFIFFMLMVVTTDSLLVFFIGWEGIGFCSYLLINFWTTRVQANKAAIKALLLNRIGDQNFILAWVLLFLVFNTNSLLELNYLILFNYVQFSVILYICSLLFLIAVIGKSAQFGLHSWLPDAMEGPTPVSALLHSATMVTAGIFLILRLNSLFLVLPFLWFVLFLIGFLTIFISGTIAVVQFDIKKIVAYSTCSQLGYMLILISFSNYSGSLFLLFNHGFFKALLFLVCGDLIHTTFNEQDQRNFKNISLLIPITIGCFVVSCWALLGLIYTTGFFPKDIIIETPLLLITFSNFQVNIFLLLIIFQLTIDYLSVLYLNICKIGFNTLYFNSSRIRFILLNNSIISALLKNLLIILSLLTFFVPFFFINVFLNFDGALFLNTFGFLIIFDAEVDSLFLANKFLTLLTFLTSFLSYWYVTLNKKGNFFILKQFTDFLMNALCIKFLQSCLLLFKILDKGIIEIFLYNGIVYVNLIIGSSLRQFLTGFVFHYYNFSIFSLFILLFLIYLFFNLI